MIFLIAVLFLFSAVNAGAEISDRSGLLAVRVDSCFEISGQLDASQWQKASPVWLEYEFSPGDNTPAPQKTEVRAVFNQECLYLGFRCYDDRPDEIRANLSDRDKIFQDDYIIVSIDTYGDYQRAYEFAVNPYGIQADLMATLDNEDADFDLIWRSAAVKGDSGWTAEMAIPFASLRFPNREEQSWRIHLVRNYPRTSRVKMSWMPVDRNNPSFLSQAGYLTGLHGIQKAGAFELLPYTMGQQAGALIDPMDASSRWRHDQLEGRVGCGLQYAPGPHFSLDAVINPDFSQIESDADQISINTTFALYYPEKRPFFLNGQELLQTPMYYSRAINNPLAAGRIIGKTGGLSYLFMSANDRNTTFVIPGEEESDTVPSHVASVANIGRLRYNYGDERYVGAMVFTRDFSQAHNYLIGLDWNYKFRKKWYFTGEMFLTHTKELQDSTLFYSSRRFGATTFDAGFNGEQYAGSGLHAVLSYNSRVYNFYIVHNTFSPTFQTYNGLFPSVDYRQFYTEQVWKIYPQRSFIDLAKLWVDANLQYNQQNLRKEQFLQPGITLTLKGQTIIEMSWLLYYDERFRGILFKDIDKALFSLSMQPTKLFSLKLEGRAGDFIYRSENPEMGKGYVLDAELEIKPHARVNAALTCSAARLTDLDSAREFYDGYILRSVLVYQFSPASFFRTIFQYNSFDQSLNLYPLFSYKMNALTTFFAGITNNFYDFGKPFGVNAVDRQYFVKMQYLIRK